MKRIAEKRVQDLHTAMIEAAQSGRAAFDRWMDDNDKPAVIEFPGGELFCQGIGGFVYAWNMQKKIVVGRLVPDDRFDANGMEGKISIQTTLAAVLLAWAELPRFRRQVRL